MTPKNPLPSIAMWKGLSEGFRTPWVKFVFETMALDPMPIEAPSAFSETAA